MPAERSPRIVGSRGGWRDGTWAAYQRHGDGDLQQRQPPLHRPAGRCAPLHDRIWPKILNHRRTLPHIPPPSKRGLVRPDGYANTPRITPSISAPENQFARDALTLVYFHRGEKELFLQHAEQTIALNPNSPYVIGVAGWHMMLYGEWDRGLALLKKGMKLNPYHPSWFHLAPFIAYYHRGEYENAEKAYQKALKTNPMNYVAYGGLATCALQKGDKIGADRYFNKVNSILSGLVNEKTLINYRQLRRILAGKNIQLIAVQYPMRNIDPLKNILGDDKSVIFVDNEQVFKDKVKEFGYEKYLIGFRSHLDIGRSRKCMTVRR